MQRIPSALAALDERLNQLEETLVVRQDNIRQQVQQQQEALRHSRAREANAVSLAQKIAARLDHAIARVEHVLRD
jgi:predicted component of type VI protein secretion system